MMKQKLYLMGLFVLLINVKSFSQSHDLTLSKAWERAFAGYPGLAEKEALIQESLYQQKEVVQDFLPQVQGQFQNTYGTFAGTSGGFFPLPSIFNVSGNNTNTQQPQTTANAFGSVLFDWKITEFGRRQKAVQAAEAGVKKAESTLDATRLALQAKVSGLYTDILYNESRLNWARDNARRVEEIVALSKTLAEAGLKPGADTLLANSAYLQTVGELNDWTGRYEASKISLTEIVPVPAGQLELAESRFLETGPGFLTADSVSMSHPYLNVLASQVENDRLRQQVAARKAYPSLSVLGGLSSRGTGINADGTVNNQWSSGFDNQADNYLIGVGLTWNISEAFKSRAETNKIRSQREASEARFEARSLQLFTSLRAINSRLTEQLTQVVKTGQAVTQARNAYELYLSRYQNGLINLTELLQIQSLLQQSEKVNIDAYRSFWEQVIQRSEISGDFTFLANHFN